MILETLDLTKEQFAERTGWDLKPQGACKGDACVLLPGISTEPLDLPAVADRLGMALVPEPRHGVWALGPESGGRALTTVEAPEVVLPDRWGNEFRLSSLRGLRVCLIAWASW